MERERISLSEALKLTLPEPPYFPQIMVAYLRFWWKYERSDPEQMWEKISRIGLDDRYREAFDYVVGRYLTGVALQQRSRRDRQSLHELSVPYLTAVALQPGFVPAS